MRTAYVIAVVAACVALAWVALAGVATFSSVHVAGSRIGIVCLEVGRTRIQPSVVQLSTPTPPPTVATAR